MGGKEGKHMKHFKRVHYHRLLPTMNVRGKNLYTLGSVQEQSSGVMHCRMIASCTTVVRMRWLTHASYKQHGNVWPRHVDTLATFAMLSSEALFTNPLN